MLYMAILAVPSRPFSNMKTFTYNDVLFLAVFNFALYFSFLASSNIYMFNNFSPPPPVALYTVCVESLN